MTPKQARKQDLPSYTIKAETPCGPCYVTVTFQNDQPFELFLRMKNNGCCQFATAEALGRAYSLALRSGADPGDVFKNLKGINCNKTAWNDGVMVTSCFDAMALAYKEAWSMFEESFGQLSLTDALTDESSHDLPFQEPQAA